MVRKLHRAAPPTFGVDLIRELVESFGRCPRWSGRQAFVFVCQVSAATPAACLLGPLAPLHTLALILEGRASPSGSPFPAPSPELPKAMLPWPSSWSTELAGLRL